jgi:HEAT repeats
MPNLDTRYLQCVCSEVVSAAILLVILSFFPISVVAQNLEGRFYPEKDSYMVGEPVIFNMEIKNTGKEVVYLNAKNPDKCLDSYEFFVSGPSSACGAKWVAGCGDEQFAMVPGDSYKGQWPLDFWYQFTHEGKYDVTATRHIPILSFRGDLQDFTFSSKFKLELTPTDPIRVQSILQGFERNLHSSDPDVRHAALDVLSATNASYFQDIALTLSRDKGPFVVLHAVGALARINTPETRAALADVLGSGKEDTEEEISSRCRVIEALGNGGDTTYLGLIQQYVDDKNDRVQLSAMIAAAELGMTEAVFHLQRVLLSANATARKNAAYALLYSKAPEAVDVLINAITDKDIKVRERVLTSLQELTEQRFGDSTADVISAEKTQKIWRSWWEAHKDQLPSHEVKGLCEMK